MKLIHFHAMRMKVNIENRIRENTESMSYAIQDNLYYLYYTLPNDFT